MATPYEQDVILDADGQPIFTALDRVQRQVERINKNVILTAKELQRLLSDMNPAVKGPLKDLQNQMQAINTVARANNNAGILLQDTDQRRKLGQLTTSITEYSRGLELAGSSVEAFQTRLNRLNDTIATRGRLGRGETITQTRQRKAWEDQRKEVEGLDKAIQNLQRRAGRTNVGPGDRAEAQAVAQRVADASAAVFNAARDPKRRSFLPEIGRYREATSEMESFYTNLRTRQAERLRDERATAKALERAETTSLNSRAAQEDKIWADRERRHSSAVKRSNDIEKAYSKDEKDRLSDRQKQMDAMWAAQEKNLQRRATTAVRLSEAEKLGLEEASRMNFGGNTGVDATRLRRLQNAAELDDMKAAGALRAKELKDISAVNSARAQSAMRLNELRAARRAANNPQDHEYLTRQIKGEQAYTAALRQRRTELESVARAEARQNGHSSPIQNILSPRYMGAAVARTTVYGAGAMAVYAMFDAIRGGLQYVTQLEDGLAKLQAIAGATDGQMVVLKQSILDVADSSRFSTVELVKISQNLAQAGVSASQMKDALESVVNLANASGSTPDEAVNLVTAALGAFQLQASEAARVADLMVTALNRTRLTVAQAGAAIQYVGATAYEQNIALDELLASAAAMSQAGVKSGSTIGTGMRQFLVDLQSPTKKLQEQFEALGLTSEQLDVSVQGLPAVLDALNGAGFGAAQAYEGLETRAAAAYLVLRNNTGLIDELRLQMSEMGTATEANAQAMDSFTAQWQRFKNIIGESAEDALKPATDGLRDLFKLIADNREEMKQLNAETGTDAMTRFLNAFSIKDESSGEYIFRLGDGIENLEDTVNSFLGVHDEFKQEQADLETQIATVSERISEHTGLISELEKEYQRLLVQEESLRNNHDRLDAETASLTARFQELGIYLDNTKGMYESLTGAVWQYIQATNQALAADLAIRQTQLANQAVNYSSERRDAYNRVMGMDQSRLTAEERRILASLRNANTMSLDDYRYASRRLAGAGRRDGVLGTELGNALNELTTAMGNVSSTLTAQTIAGRQENATLAAGTRQGATVSLLREGIESKLTQARSQRGGERDATVREIRSMIAQARDTLNFTPKEQFSQYFQSQRSEIDSLEQMLKAMLTPSSSERQAAERERKADKIVSFGSPVGNGNVTSGMGSRWGRQHKGVDIGVAVGTPVMATADGVVKKRGFDRDGYGNYLYLDHGAGTETRYAHLSQMDVVEGQQLTKGQVLGRSGGARGAAGAGNSRGPHLHYELRRDGKPVNPFGNYAVNGDFTKDSERYEEAAAREIARVQKAIDARDVKLAEKALALRVTEAAKATTSQAFETSMEAIEGNMDHLEAMLRKQAANEMDAAQLGPLDAEYQDRMDQLETDIQQRRDEYQQKLVESIFSNVQNAFEAAERATAAVLYDYDRAIRMAQARVSGLGYASNEGRIPEYMQQLAQRRVAEGEEARDRARLGALPAEIGAMESALETAEAQLALMDRSNSAYEEQRVKVEELTKAIRDLRDEKDALFTALNVADEMPKTLAEGMEKAIAAYRQYNDLNRTLQEEVIFNMGGALQQVHDGLNGFFTDVFTGSKGVLAAFGDMVMGIFKYMQQLAAQFVANQIFKMLLNFAGNLIGGSTMGGAASNSLGLGAATPFANAYFGGKVEGGLHNPIRRRLGGKVLGGTRAMDSVHTMLARDEWVINRSAVASVGDDFMADLNRRGAMAVRDAAGSPMQMFQMPKQETNVYVVPPNEKPSLGPNDVLVVMREDMVNGEGRKLIRTIAQGG